MSPESAAERGLTSTFCAPVGNLAPEGSVIKSTAIDPSVIDADGVYRFTGPAKVFVTEPAAIAAIKAGRIHAGDVLVLICRGPLGAGMEETYQLTSALKYLPFGKHVALLTDARFSGVSTGACIGHVSPEALSGGPIGKLRDGDLVEIVIDRATLDGTVNFVGEGGVNVGAEAGARILAAPAVRAPIWRPIRACRTTPACGRRCRTSSGGAWGGSVFDVDADPQGARGGKAGAAVVRAQLTPCAGASGRRGARDAHRPRLAAGRRRARRRSSSAATAFTTCRAVAATCSGLLALDDPLAAVRAGDLPRIGSVADLLENSAHDRRDRRAPWLLAPCDLQAVKASGVTFVASLLERVIEEQARGDAAKAEGLRQSILSVIGNSLHDVRPGSPEAARLKDVLIGQGVWSQYLEVGIGPGRRDLHQVPAARRRSAPAPRSASIRKSEWNNPEPEVVLAVTPAGRVVGATLGNDVNLRDFEGRSALLLGKAKDNNASCAIGPFIRLFDETFSHRRRAAVRSGAAHRGPRRIRVHRPQLDGRDQPRSARDRRATPSGRIISIPTASMLFLGTMFAPTVDRFAPGKGFTHLVGDVVTVSTPKLGHAGQPRQSHRQDRAMDVRRIWRALMDESARDRTAADWQLTGTGHGNMLKQFPNYIDGEWVMAASWSPNRNPSDLSDVIGEYAQADAAQTKTAIAAAKARISGVVDRWHPGSRQHPRQGRLGHPRAQGRDRPAARARRREDAARRRRRDRPRRAHLQVLRRRGAAPGRGEAAFGPSRRRRRDHPRADRRRRPDHAVEFSDRHSRLEDRAGARVRQHRRLQAGAVDARLRLGAGRHPGGRRHSAGRLQPGDGIGVGRRRHAA